MTDAVIESRRGPGRPRSAECDAAIMEATLVEYADAGFDGLSVDAVAARAGCSKATIYRRYPSKLDLVITASRSVAEELAPELAGPTLRDDLDEICWSLARKLQHPLFGRVMAMVVGDATRHDDVRAMHSDLVRMRRQPCIEALQRAVERGEMRDGVDLDAAVDQLGGPLFYRHLVTRMPIDEAYVNELIDSFIASYGV
ncbi:MAG TPA: TetR/AcrR family transcriptional regulator [Acidimicrobiia bacterium]|nr:TetR/AcrR family transcriptional regulator [Acidimicrobiia bacterium]